MKTNIANKPDTRAIGWIQEHNQKIRQQEITAQRKTELRKEKAKQRMRKAICEDVICCLIGVLIPVCIFFL